MHPGGVKKINLGIGKESTTMFHKFHKGIKLELTPLPGLVVGQLFSYKNDFKSDVRKPVAKQDGKDKKKDEVTIT